MTNVSVLSQVSRRAFLQDYKPIALRVGLQFGGRSLMSGLLAYDHDMV
jgi:hypothetical protein